MIVMDRTMKKQLTSYLTRILIKHIKQSVCVCVCVCVKGPQRGVSCDYTPTHWGDTSKRVALRFEML